MKEIIKFLNDNNGALMVVITLVYVIATVLICIFNYKSSKAADKQLDESKRQFNETTRLSHLPVLTISTNDGIKNNLFNNNQELFQITTSITIKNIGHCTAQLVEAYFDFGYDEEEKYDEICRYLAVNETTRYSFASFYSDEIIKNGNYKSEVKLHLRFGDLLGNKYKQTIIIKLKNAGSKIVAFSCDVGDVILIKHRSSL